MVRHAPYAQRSARAQLDVALAAATLELPLEVYFLGDGVWQIASGRDSDTALLPRGLKGWGALAELTDVRYFATSEVVAQLRELGVDTVVEPEALNPDAMRQRWQDCDKVLTL